MSRIYLDACCFVAYLLDEERRADVVATLLELARRDEVQLLTSMLSIAEVASAGDSVGADGVHEAIAGLLEDADVVQLVDVSLLVARDAQRIVSVTRASELNTIKPMDALHLASAIRAGAEVFYTYDEKLLLHGEIDGLLIKQPHAAQVALFIGGEGEREP